MRIVNDRPWNQKLWMDEYGHEKSASSIACEESQINQVSEQLFEYISSGKEDLVKEAASILNDFIPTRIREESFFELAFPSETITNEELDRAQDDEGLFFIIDMEGPTPAAMTTSFNTGLPGSPEMEYVMYARRIKGGLNRIKTRTFVKDVDLFSTWRHDLQQVFADNAVRDVLAEIDTQFIRAVRTFMGGAPNTVLASSNMAHWIQVGGAISRASLNPALNLLLKTPSSLPVSTVISNQITMNEFTALDRLEVGGDLAQDLFTKGVQALPDIRGIKWISTIKRGLVPDLRWHIFGPARFAVRHKVKTPPTMHIETKDLQVRFWIHTTRGFVLCQENAMGIVDFMASY